MTQADATLERTTARPGRPREDLHRRRTEIFAAVAPLLLEHGPRALTMRRLARAAHVSVGGLYRYFSSKMDLLSFPLQDEPCAEMLRRFEVAHHHLAATDPDAYVAAFIDQMVDAFPLLRASFTAVVEMGGEGFWEALDEGIGGELEDRLVVLAAARGEDFDVRKRARSLKRIYLGAVLDRSLRPNELRVDLHTALR